MAKLAARWGLGMCVAAVLLANGVVVLARTGSTEGVAGDGGVARSASLTAGELESERTTVTTAGAAGTPAPAGPEPADRTTTTRPASVAPTTSTTNARPVPTTSNTVVGEPEGFRGSGLYVANVDGTGVRRLAPGYGMFTWSPDGTMVAYSAGDDLHIARADGSGRTVLAAGKGALAPAWSPDGTRIAFTRSGGGSYVVPAGGSGPATLVAPDGQLVGWTPGGELIVIVPPPQSGYASVVAYDRAGARRVLATDGSTFVQPEPSPDGRLVAYMGNGIWVAAVDGSGSRALTGLCCGDESVGSPLAWSPDGRLLAYLNQGSVRVVGADGSGDRVLAADASAPTWSPDGRQLAVVGGSTTRADGFLFSTLQVMPAGGGARKTIVDGAPKLSVLAPQWSPSGRQLAFVMSAGEPPPL